MAGEITKSARLTSLQGDQKLKSAARLSRCRLVSMQESDAIAATELEAADSTILELPIPSNAVVTEIAVYNDDLDSNVCPLLTLDVGLFAAQDFTSVTSGTKTKHVEDGILDVDAYVDGSTTLQAATTSWTVQAFDATTFGPDDAEKACWEVLGFDEDPKVDFRIGVTFPAAAATAAAGDLAIRVQYLVD